MNELLLSAVRKLSSMLFVARAALVPGEHQERRGSPRGELWTLGLLGGLCGVLPDAQDEARAGETWYTVYDVNHEQVKLGGTKCILDIVAPVSR